MTFAGTPPWGQIVCWVGADEWGRNIWMELYNYFPEDEQFYVELTGSGQRGRLVHEVMVGWNRDMRRFVEELRWRPSFARDEIRRIYEAIFLAIVQVIADVFIAGGAEVTAQRIASQAEEIADAVVRSRQNGRRLFALAFQRGQPTVIIFRGTTYRLRLGDVAEEFVHDLGPGLYFTTDPQLAATYAAMRGTVDDPAIILQAEVARAELGRVLDLIDGPFAARFKERIEQLPQNLRHTRNYFNMLEGFLAEVGHTIDDFDVVIGREYLRDGVQIKIRRDTSVLDRVLEKCTEIIQ